MGDFASHVDLIDVADFEHPISIHIFKPTSFYMYNHNALVQQLLMFPRDLSSVIQHTLYYPGS